jgi:hypothetical protein
MDANTIGLILGVVGVLSLALVGTVLGLFSLARSNGNGNGKA